MTTALIAIIVALIAGVAGYTLGRRAGLAYGQRLVASAVQQGLLHFAHPASGYYDDLSPKFVEPTITGDATLETDHRDPPTGQYL